MYGDNQNLMLGGIGLILVLILGTLSVVSLVKIHHLEESLALVSAGKTEIAPPVKAAEKGEPPAKEDDDEVFYRALDLWEQKEEETEAARTVGTELTEQNWDFLNEWGLTLTESSSLYAWTLNRTAEAGENPLFFLEYGNGEWSLKAQGGDTFSFTRVNGRTEEFIRGEMEKRERLKSLEDRSIGIFHGLLADGELKNLAVRKGCFLSETREGENLRGLAVLTEKDGRTVVSALWNGESLTLNGEDFTDHPEDLSGAFQKALAGADTRSDEDIFLSRGLERIRRLYGDKKFTSRLEKMGLYPRYLEREDADFVYLDLVDEQGELRASFGVKRYTGRIHILDSQGISLASLDSLQPADVPLPENLADLDKAYEDGDSFNVLIVGYHNQGTDTMILVHVNRKSEKVSLISIPRDLWWEGHKLNSYFFGSGKEDFLDIMTQVSGLQVDYYLSVDMYAFIDLVNALGGIDVTLEQEVRDPTYKIIRENGTAGTLYYPPGTYHLNGVEALRLARSRHGSSDFERSLLQQKILSALRTRTEEISLGDIGLFKSFLAIASRQTQTNMSLPFMVSHFLKMKDYEWDGGHNLNDETLLYNTYTEYLNLSPSELPAAREREDFSRGQWILLPLGQNWDLIKTRVRQIIGG